MNHSKTEDSNDIQYNGNMLSWPIVNASVWRSASYKESKSSAMKSWRTHAISNTTEEENNLRFISDWLFSETDFDVGC